MRQVDLVYSKKMLRFKFNMIHMFDFIIKLLIFVSFSIQVYGQTCIEKASTDLKLALREEGLDFELLDIASTERENRNRYLGLLLEYLRHDKHRRSTIQERHSMPGAYKRRALVFLLRPR